MRTAIFLLFLAAAAYTALCWGVWAFQERLVYRPARAPGLSPRAFGLEAEALRLPLPDGGGFDAWFLDRPKARAAVLFCHGNAGHLGHRADLLARIHGLGCAVMGFDYPGYGASDGRPTEEAVLAAARAARRALAERARGRPLVYWGRSLGASVAAAVAAETPPAALILEAAFTSIPKMAERVYPWLPVSYLCRIRHDTKEALRSTQVPVLLLHGRRDDLVPQAMAEELAAAAGARAQLVLLDAGHDDLHAADPAAYDAAILGFLERALPQDPRDE